MIFTQKYLHNYYLNLQFLLPVRNNEKFYVVSSHLKKYLKLAKTCIEILKKHTFRYKLRLNEIINFFIHKILLKIKVSKLKFP